MFYDIFVCSILFRDWAAANCFRKGLRVSENIPVVTCSSKILLEYGIFYLLRENAHT